MHPPTLHYICGIVRAAKVAYIRFLQTVDKFLEENHTIVKVSGIICAKHLSN